MADPVTIATAVGWGISILGWVISPIISKLVNKGLGYLNFTGSSANNLQNLEEKILHLKRMLEAAQVSPDDEKKLEGWAKKLKSAFYDAEDILDAIDYHRLECKAMLHRQSVNTSKQVRCSVPLYIYEKQSVICSPLVSSSIWHGSHLRNVRV